MSVDIAPKFSTVMPSMTVDDLPGAVAFYESVLGFRCVFTNGNPLCFAIVKRDGIEISLSTERLGGVAGQNGCYIKLSEGIESLYAEYQELGATIAHPLKVEEYRMKEFMIEDPEGNTLNFGQPV